MSKSSLVLIVLLIVLESGACFSNFHRAKYMYNKTKANANYFGHSNEHRSKENVGGRCCFVILADS